MEFGLGYKYKYKATANSLPWDELTDDITEENGRGSELIGAIGAWIKF